MDTFYLENAKLYQRLVDQVQTSGPAAHFSRHTAAPTVEEESTEHTGIIITARIRPMLDNDIAEGLPCALYPRKAQSSSAQVVDVHDLYHHPRWRPQLKSSKYRVDRLFNDRTSGKDTHNSLVANLVAFAKDGGIGTLLAYGQTGSGKTFTINQLQELVVPALLADASILAGDFEIYITIVELAGNSAYDLLNSRKPIAVREDSQGTMHLAGAAENRITDPEQALEFLERAAAFRRTESTQKNDTSSRSHSICRIRLHNSNNGESTANDGLLYMVDLAGSEAARDIFDHSADRMRETREINVSLSALKDCLRGKAELENARETERSRNVHVPIR